MNTSHEYQIHLIAQCLPEMAEDQYNVLKQSIERDGLRNPIILYEGKILDGRHRYRACEELCILPKFDHYSGREPATRVFVNNVARRDLTIPQKLHLLDHFLPQLESEARRRQVAGRSLASTDAKGKAAAIAAKSIGVSPATVERYQAIKRAIARLEAAGHVAAANKVRKAAQKSVRAGSAAAAAAGIMFELEPELLGRLRTILSAEEIRCIEQGTVPLETSDLRLWITLGLEEAQKAKELVFGLHWTVRQAVRFLRGTLTGESRICELMNRCIAARGNFEVTIGGYRITVAWLNPKGIKT
jgi:hypothetical protein